MHEIHEMFVLNIGYIVSLWKSHDERMDLNWC